MKKVVALLVILLLVFSMATSMAYASRKYDMPPGRVDKDGHDLHGRGVGFGHDIHGDGDNPTIGPGNSSDAPAWGHVPEFPLVALPGIVGFAGLALAWLKRFFYR
jgi:hypothetical protein